jgi:hypothetical protein
MTTIGLLICKSGTTGVTTPLYNAYPIDWYCTLGFATATASSIRFTIASGATEAISFVSDATVPGVLNWSAGNYVWEATIVTGNTRIMLYEVVLRRLSNNLATVNTYFSSGSISSQTMITGKYATGTLAPNFATLNPAGCLSDDRLQLLFVMRNATNSARTVMPNLNVSNSEFYSNIQLPVSDTFTLTNNAKINIVKGFTLIHNLLVNATLAISEFTSNVNLFLLKDYVSDVLTIINNDKARVSDTFIIKHLTKINVTKAIRIINLLKARVADTLTLVYTMKAKVSDTFTIIYSNRINIAKTIKLLYTIKAYVSKTLTSIYKLKAYVYKTLTSIYTLKAIVSKTFKPIYTLKAYVNDTFTIKYNGLMKIVKASSFLYTIKANVSKSVSIVYNVRINIAKTLRLIYTLKAYVNKTLTAIYTIKANIAKTFSTIYLLKANVTKTFVSLYSLKNNISKSLTLLFGNRNNITKLFTSLYSSLNNISRIFIMNSDFNNGNIFNSGFETKTFADWAFTEGSPSIVNVPHSGGYSATSNVINADRWWLAFSGQSDLFVRFYVMFADIPTAWFMLGGTAENTWAQFSWLGYNSDGSTWANIHFSDEYNSCPIFNVGKWYCIEVERKVGDASNGKIRVWIDGTLYLDVTKEVLLNAEYWISGIMDAYYRAYFDDYAISSSPIGMGTLGYNIRSYISKAISSIYTIRMNINKAISLMHNIRNNISKKFSIVYQLLTAVAISMTFAIKYNVRVNISKTVTSIHNIRVNISKVLTSLYTIKSNISKLFTITYRQLQNISKTLRLIYGNRIYVNKLFTSLHSIRLNVSKVFRGIYNVKANITKAITLSYTLKAYVNKVFTSLYNVRGYINKLFTSMHNVRVNIAKSFTNMYNVRANIDRIFVMNSKFDNGNIFNSGFVDGTTAGWSGSEGSPSVISTIKHTGNFALECKTTNNDDVYYNTPTTYSIAYYRFYAYFESLPTILESVPFCQVYASDWSHYSVVVMRNNGATTEWGLIVPSGQYFVTASIVTGKWYCLELYLKSGNGNGITRLYVDGINVLSKETETQVASFQHFYCGINGYKGNAAMVFDDVSISDSYIGLGILGYNIKSNIAKSLTIIHKLYAKVNKIFTAIYSITLFGTVMKLLTVSYTNRAFVNKITTSLYGIRNNVSKTLKLQWNNIARLLKSITILYNNKSLVSKLISFNYKLGVSINKLITIAYNGRANISKSLTSIYLLKINITKSLTQLYNIRAFVIKTFRGMYNVRANIAKVITLSYTLRAYVNKLFTSLYNVRINIVKSLKVVYTIRSNVARTFTITYNSLLKILTTITLKYNSMAFVTKTLTITDKLLSNIAKLFELRYDSRAYIFARLIIKFTGGAIVGSLIAINLIRYSGNYILLKTKALAELLKNKSESSKTKQGSTYELIREDKEKSTK